MPTIIASTFGFDVSEPAPEILNELNSNDRQQIINNLFMAASQDQEMFAKMRSVQNSEKLVQIAIEYGFEGFTAKHLEAHLWFINEQEQRIEAINALFQAANQDEGIRNRLQEAKTAEEFVRIGNEFVVKKFAVADLHKWIGEMKVQQTIRDIFTVTNEDEENIDEELSDHELELVSGGTWGKSCRSDWFYNGRLVVSKDEIVKTYQQRGWAAATALIENRFESFYGEIHHLADDQILQQTLAPSNKQAWHGVSVDLKTAQVIYG